MSGDMLWELKQEENKYREIYDKKEAKNYVLDGLKADAFKMAVTMIENKGLRETYKDLKNRRDKYSQSITGGNLANAFDLIIGKLWKHYKKLNSQSNENKNKCDFYRDGECSKRPPHQCHYSLNQEDCEENKKGED